MKYFILTLLLASSSAWAITAFLQDEYVDGLYRTCIYDAAGSEYSITISSYKLCPMSIEV